jgi:hypothetical protein
LVVSALKSGASSPSRMAMVEISFAGGIVTPGLRRGNVFEPRFF